MNSYPAISLVSNIQICDRAYANHPSADDLTGCVHVSWGLERKDGTKVGGLYTTHDGAARTKLEFPEYFAGTRIVPYISRKVGYHSYTADRIDHAIEPGTDPWML